MKGSLSNEELQRLMLRVDEQMAQGALAPAEEGSTPDLDDLARRLTRLRQMRAPLLVVGGYGPGAILRRLLNLPVQVFGYKQRRFNEELLDTLDATLDLLRRQQHELGVLRAAHPASAEAAPPER